MSFLHYSEATVSCMHLLCVPLHLAVGPAASAQRICSGKRDSGQAEAAKRQATSRPGYSNGWQAHCYFGPGLAAEMVVQSASCQRHGKVQQLPPSMPKNHSLPKHNESLDVLGSLITLSPSLRPPFTGKILFVYADADVFRELCFRLKQLLPR